MDVANLQKPLVAERDLVVGSKVCCGEQYDVQNTAFFISACAGMTGLTVDEPGLLFFIDRFGPQVVVTGSGDSDQ